MGDKAVPATGGKYAPTGSLPGGDPLKFYFPDTAIDAFAAEAQKAAPALTRNGPLRPTNEITEGPRFTPEQARELIQAAMNDFDPALGKSAEKIFDAGFDTAVSDARKGIVPDWNTVKEVQPPQRWRIGLQTGPHQQCLPADTPKNDFGPKNPNNYAIIDYQFDGTISSLVYMAHELGHTIADDNMHKAGAHTWADNPQHMQELQAYFTQHVLYDYIRRHPELNDKYPGITQVSQKHYSATMAENIAFIPTALRSLDERRAAGEAIAPEKAEALDKIINRLQIRPPGILGAQGLFDIASADEAHRAEITASVLNGQGRPKTFSQVLAGVGVKNAQDLQRFAGNAVASATRPADPAAHAPVETPEVKKTPVVNIVIDLGDWDPQHSKGSKADHDAYIKKVNASVDALCKQGIPTIFVAITDDSVAHPGSQPRDPQLIKRLHMTELHVQPGDDIFEKRFMSGFTTIDEVKASPTVEKYVTGQRKDGAEYAKATFSKTTLEDLLKARGAEHVTLMGAVAQYCITDNAIDAARRGFGVTVITDTVLGWNDKKALDKVVVPKDAKTAAKQVAETLQEVRDNPQARGIEEKDAPAALAAMKNIKLLTLDRFLASAPALQAPKTEQSKFLAPAAEEPARAPVKGNAVQEHGGTATGVAAVGVDIAEGRYGRAVTDAAMQLSLTPATYEAAAHLAEEAGSVAKVLGSLGKRVPIAGAFITGGFVLYEVGANIYEGKFGKAGTALAAGAAETVGNIAGFGVGDVARETVREGVVLTAGEDYAPNKSGLRELGERAYALGSKAVSGGETQKPAAAAPKLSL